MLYRLLVIAIRCQPVPVHKLLYNSNHDETHNVNARKRSGEINLWLELAFILQTTTEEKNFTYFSETT